MNTNLGSVGINCMKEDAAQYAILEVTNSKDLCNNNLTDFLSKILAIYGFAIENRSL